MVELDILGATVSASKEAIARVRDLAAAQAGRSASARDLSLVLERALNARSKVALQRGETRALLDLIDQEDPDLAALAEAARARLNTH